MSAGPTNLYLYNFRRCVSLCWCFCCLLLCAFLPEGLRRPARRTDGPPDHRGLGTLLADLGSPNRQKCVPGHTFTSLGTPDLSGHPSTFSAAENRGCAAPAGFCGDVRRIQQICYLYNFRGHAITAWCDRNGLRPSRIPAIPRVREQERGIDRGFSADSCIVVYLGRLGDRAVVADRGGFRDCDVDLDVAVATDRRVVPIAVSSPILVFPRLSRVCRSGTPARACSARRSSCRG